MPCRGQGTADLDSAGAQIDQFAALKGTLNGGDAQLLKAYQMQDEMGRVAYGVWYYVNLQRDQDLKDADMDAARQRVQVLFAKWGQSTSWSSPEHLELPLDTVRGWMESNLDLGLYRFAIEDLYRQQAHVLDEGGETLLAYWQEIDNLEVDDSTRTIDRQIGDTV